MIKLRPHTYAGNPDDLSMSIWNGTCDYGTWLRWVEEAEDWQYLTVKAGRMARKSDLDAWLVKRHGITLGDAHDIANHIESKNRRIWHRFGNDVQWALSRPEPTYEQYPDIEEQL